MQGLFLGICGIGKGIVVLLVVTPAAILAGGEILLLQMTPEYMELAEAIGMQVREWSTADGTESIFKVMVIGTPKIKARYGNQTGIVHATGA